jgi:hypothetical protein
MNFSDWENAQEAANVGACREAFVKAHPLEPISRADDCDDGSWLCAECPWSTKNEPVDKRCE